MHPDQETLKAMMERAGFDRVEYFNLAPASSRCIARSSIRAALAFGSGLAQPSLAKAKLMVSRRNLLPSCPSPR